MKKTTKKTTKKTVTTVQNNTTTIATIVPKPTKTQLIEAMVEIEYSNRVAKRDADREIFNKANTVFRKAVAEYILCYMKTGKGKNVYTLTYEQISDYLYNHIATCDETTFTIDCKFPLTSRLKDMAKQVNELKNETYKSSLSYDSSRDKNAIRKEIRAALAGGTTDDKNMVTMLLSSPVICKELNNAICNIFQRQNVRAIETK